MKHRNYKTILRITVIHFLFFIATATVYSGTLQTAQDSDPKKEKKSDGKEAEKPVVFVDEPKKVTKAEEKEYEEITSRIFTLGNPLEIVMPNMRGLKMNSEGSMIIDKNVIIANSLREKPALPVVNSSASVEDNADSTNEESADSTEEATNDAVLAESDSDDIVYESTAINFTQILDRVQGSFVPERNREINTGFIIKVPKEMLSPKWGLVLSPKLLLNDSVIALKEVILKGSEFTDKQKKSYQDYQDFLGSIVNKHEYDKHFVDRDGINKDLRTLQDVYYNKYYSEWSNQVEFENWRTKTIDKKTRDTARKVGQRQELYYKSLRDILEESMLRLSKGKDTTGVYARHMKSFEKKAKNLPVKFIKPEITLDEVPKEFKEIYQVGRKIEDISNGYMTEQDSIEVAKHRYLFDKIAENEMKDSLKEQRESHYIPFPFKRDAMADSLVGADSDFLFYYPHVSRIAEGNVNYRLVVDGKIDVFPNNTFDLPKKDPIPYAVSSLVDLINDKLVIKETAITRALFNRTYTFPKFEKNKSEFNVNYADNKAAVQKVISEYQEHVEKKGLVADSILIRVYTSLDGYYQHNMTLAQNRGNSIKKFMTTIFPQIDAESVFRVRAEGEDWSGFVSLIRKRDDIVNKEAILEMVSATTVPDLTEQEIKSKFKKDYKIIKDSIYPLLQNVEFMTLMHRPGMVEEDGTEYTEQPGYENGLKLMRERKYWDALQILSEYPDYNTALCLACMGHNDRAYDVIKRLKEDAEINYLRAIVAFRLGNEEEAIQYLESACELDPSKAERVPYDPEMVLLIEKNNL